MHSFHQALSFHSFEAAVNGVARLARTQGFRIHQRKGPQKNSYELQGIASFGCTAPGCGWFITLRRLPLDGPSTSTAPAELWTVYTINDNHRSTCKPSRSRRRRPSISSITSLETENTEDELPPELLQPYERSPSLPIVMHARGSRVEAVTITAVPLPSPETFQAPPALSNGHANPTQEETPDPLELSKYIQDLLASLDQQPPQPDDIAMAIDPKALLATLNEPLPFPPGFLVPQSTTSTPNVASQQYPFSEHNSAVNTVQPLSGTLAIDLARLPEGWQREADILNTNEHTTIDPSQLHSSNQVNGHQPYSSSLPSFGHHHRDKQDSPRQGGYDHSYQEYAAPVSMHDWSDSDSDEGAGEPDLSQDFLQQSYDGLAGVDDYSTELWQGSTNGMDFHDAENQDETLHPHANGDPESSSDSDIPAEALININTSRSQRSETPKDANGNQSSPHHRQPSYETEPPDTHQADYEPYGPVAPLSQTARLPYTSTRQPTFPNQSPRTAADIADESFDIYKIFHSFEEAEASILSNARKLGLPLKIRYRPNPLDSSMNARRQACLECLRLCGYRIYLKDDHRSQWRVINMEGGHKTSCYQGSSKPKVQRGTNPFRHHRHKDRDSMQVSVPVVQQTGSKRKRRQASFSSDRSSSPSILVVTHSDAVMKSVRTIGPGFTPPPDYFHASPSPDAIRPIKKKGKGKIRKSGRTADKPIELEDSDDQGGPPHHFPMEEDYLPPPLRNGIAHPSSQNEVSPQNGDSASQSAQYARKKLPTTQQLVHGSSRPDILPRHKIPTKPLGRSPALNRARRERRQARGSASKNPRFGFGHGIGEMLPDESSANDDDEDMFYQIGVFNENGNSNGPSPRALRRLQRGRRLSKSTRPLPSNGHHVQQAVNLDADILPSTSDAYKSGSRSATRSRGRPPKDARRSIHPHIALKMTLSQAGLSSQQVAFMKKGGYATVKDLTREGLACSVADFSVFSSWLDDLTIPQECMQDSQLIRQAVRARVKSIAEEVCVRSTVVWEAAGMMEEGSDVDEDEAMSQTRNGHSHTTNGEASVQDRYRLEHALYTDDEDYSRFLPSPKRASTNGRKTDTRAEVAVPLDPLSDSSGIEFLGVRQ